MKTGTGYSFTTKYSLSAEQVAAVVLHEMEAKPSLLMETLRGFTSKQLNDLVLQHLHRSGFALLSKPLPDRLLVNRQEVISSLKGILRV